MRILAIILISLLLVSATVDIIITDGNGTTAQGNSIDWGGKITKDVIIESDSIGKRLIWFGVRKPLGQFQIDSKDSINNQESNFTMSPGLIILTTSDLNYPSQPGGFIQFTPQALTYTDTKPIPTGIQYTQPNCVTTQGSLTDKRYVDINQMIICTKTTLPSAFPSGKQIFVSNATGGACPAYSDGSHWKRFSDNSIIN